MSLSLWSRTKAGYNDIRNSGTNLLCLPSPRQLSRIKNQISTKPSFNNEVYQNIDLTFKKLGETRIGQLMCDELNCKKQLIINSKSNDTVGLVSRTGSIRDIIRDDLEYLLEKKIITNKKRKKDNKEEEYKEDNIESNDEGVITYVNLFRFRSIMNKSYNLEYFFNDGSMTSDDVLGQALHAIGCLTMIGFTVLGIVCDAGGANSGLHRLLRKGETLPDDTTWLDKNYTSFKHPCLVDMIIVFWYCATHALKSIRNSFLQSIVFNCKKYNKTFLSMEGIPFGWDNLERLFLRELEQEERSSSKVTRLSQGVVYPDRWNKMNVSFAKIPFEEKTIIEILLNAVDLCENSEIRRQLFLEDNVNIQQKSFVCPLIDTTNNNVRLQHNNLRMTVCGFF